MILGISCLEAAVKFTAPTLTLPVGLDVGRHVFAAFNKVEIAGALASLGLALAGRPGRRVPLLDRRTEMILAGQTPPAAPYHRLYIALEAGKLIALLRAGILLAARRR